LPTLGSPVDKIRNPIVVVEQKQTDHPRLAQIANLGLCTEIPLGFKTRSWNSIPNVLLIPLLLMFPKQLANLILKTNLAMVPFLISVPGKCGDIGSGFEKRPKYEFSSPPERGSTLPINLKL
jgi:hypothetical protein